MLPAARHARKAHSSSQNGGFGVDLLTSTKDLDFQSPANYRHLSQGQRLGGSKIKATVLN